MTKMAFFTLFTRISGFYCEFLRYLRGYLRGFSGYENSDFHILSDLDGSRFHEGLLFPKLFERFRKFRKVSVIGHLIITFLHMVSGQ